MGFLKNGFRLKLVFWVFMAAGLFFLGNRLMAQEQPGSEQAIDQPAGNTEPAAAEAVAAEGMTPPEEVYDTLSQEKIIVRRGDIVELKVYGMTRVAIVEPGIIDIVNADVDNILIVGSREGETPIFIWDAKGKRRIETQVIPRDLDYIISRMQKLFEEADVEGVVLSKNELEGKIVASGQVQKERKDQFQAILDKFGDHVINLVADDARLIEIDVQITELSASVTRNLGLTWPTSVVYDEQFPPNWQGNVGDLFRIADFRRTAKLTATVNLAVSEGKGRILSKPNVVVTNGEDATFLVGGEIPITTTTSTNTETVQNVSYKSYGIDLTVTPTIQQNDKIDVLLSVAIRDVDGTVQGNNTAFTTRTADTKLLLNDGQTIVLAGLIKQSRGTSESGVPFLRKIPVVGLLFRHKNWTPHSDTEVVISLTPHILGNIAETKGAKRKTALAEVAQDVKQKSDAYLAKEEPEELARQKAMEAANTPEETNEGVSEDVPMNLPQEEVGPTTAAEPEAEAGPVVAAEPVAEAGLAEETGPAAEELSAEVEDVSQYLTDYVHGVQKKIAGAISFPYEAKEKGWEGTVDLDLKILSDGTLNQVAVKTSSGHDIFDKDAVNTAKIIAPFGPFPAEVDLEELDVTIPVMYSQQAVLEGAEGPSN